MKNNNYHDGGGIAGRTVRVPRKKPTGEPSMILSLLSYKESPDEIGYCCIFSFWLIFIIYYVVFFATLDEAMNALQVLVEYNSWCFVPMTHKYNDAIVNE